jgi:hypothetical protein
MLKIKKMKKKFIIITLQFFICFALLSQSPDWEWGRCIGSINEDYSSGIAADLNGNVYITGYTEGNDLITFDSITYISGYFIAKYSPTGVVQWAKGNDSSFFYCGGEVRYPVIDINGNILVTAHGNICDTMGWEFGILILKYNSSGNLKWVKNVCNSSDVLYPNISTDLIGNIYLTGSFSSPTLTIGSTVLTNVGNGWDVFIAKYDSSGNAIWAKSAGGNWDIHSTSITTDMNCNVYITGYFHNSASFDSIILTSSGYSDIFIAKYNSSGDVLWAKSAGGSISECANSITTDNVGYIYITGVFYSHQITFDSITVTNTDIENCDIFIAKYNSSGNVIWAKSAGGGNNDASHDISTDADGNVYITGAFWSPQITFDSIMLTNMGYDNCYIAKYDSSGNIQWAKRPDGDGASASGIVTVLNSNVYITGSFTGLLIFGDDTLINNPLYSPDVFVAKLSGSGSSINKIDPDNLTVVYPNPSGGNFVISNLPASGQIQIINSTGQTIKTTRFRDQANINFTLAESGIYIIRVMTDKGAVTKKVVVCRSE